MVLLKTQLYLISPFVAIVEINIYLRIKIA